MSHTPQIEHGNSAAVDVVERKPPAKTNARPEAALRRDGALGPKRLSDGRRAQWQSDPTAFARLELGARLWETQAAILEAVRDCPRVAVRSCNGSGKTYTAAHATLWWLMCFPDAVVITTAPTERQVKEVLWREIRRIYTGHKTLFGGKLLRNSLELGEKHFAQGLSTDSPERFQGFHEGHILFVVDEASGVREGIFEAMEGSMTSQHAHMLLLGNPTSRSGYFYEAFHRRRSFWRTICIPAFDTPNAKKNDPSNPGLTTKNWAEEAFVNWGKGNPLYEIRVSGDFPTESEDTLIPLKLIERAAQRSAKSPQTDGGSGGNEPVEMGVDVARFGSDRTAICVRKGERVIELLSYAKKDTMETTGMVNSMARRHSAKCIRVDVIGIGAGVVDRLKELELPGVEGVNVAQQATDQEHFANLRAELYDGLRERFQEGRIGIPRNERLISELAGIRYSFTSSGRMRLESKDELRKAGQPSPDLADALMLAFAQADRPKFNVWV